MFQVLITDYLAPPPTIEQRLLSGLAKVECLEAKAAKELAGRADAADALIVFHEVTLPRAIIERLTRCRVIVRCGTGYDQIDLSAAAERGVPVCNVPDYGVDEVADHAIALMLACNRRLLQAERGLRQTLAPWNYHAVQTIFRLSGATLGIIGLGRIGTATAMRAKGLKMRVVACDPYLRSGLDKAVGVTLVDLNTLLAESDVISLHVPLTDETRNMIDGVALGKMKPHAILLNTSRGAVVDTGALAAALEQGRIGGAGIDVLPTEPPDGSEPLVKMWRQACERPVNLVLTPHTAFYSEAGLVEMREKAAQEVARVLSGEAPRNCVNEHLLKAGVVVGR
ncbi:MAG TPA: C-terminal binding protein [Phycisphaerae bacterium]|nr:C-terminal binding protein [Phycisphaerae bacterium]HRY68693.1 C-terminal binding protein [Phycisphaerae bacterium]HSA25519.1 C-terminal binding protein [Phycisphaerae bacterium]